MSTHAKKIKEDLEKRIDKKVKLKALGNDQRTMRDLAVDLINASGEKSAKISQGCFLATTTIDNLADDITKNPQSDTVARIFKYFGYEMQLNRVHITAKHLNKPKIGK